MCVLIIIMACVNIFSYLLVFLEIMVSVVIGYIWNRNRIDAGCKGFYSL